MICLCHKEVKTTAKIAFEDLYYEKYCVPGMALKKLIVAMANGLPPKNGMEFYNMAIAKHTILVTKQEAAEGNSISDIDTELPSFCRNSLN